MNAVPLIPRRYWIAALALVALMASLLLLMGRPPICTCGTVKLWVATVNGPDNSQHIADWYTPSHVIHGFSSTRSAGRSCAATRRATG